MSARALNLDFQKKRNYRSHLIEPDEYSETLELFSLIKPNRTVLEFQCRVGEI